MTLVASSGLSYTRFGTESTIKTEKNVFTMFYSLQDIQSSLVISFNLSTKRSYH